MKWKERVESDAMRFNGPTRSRFPILARSHNSRVGRETVYMHEERYVSATGPGIHTTIYFAKARAAEYECTTSSTGYEDTANY